MRKRLQGLSGPSRWGLVVVAFLLGTLLDGYHPRLPLGPASDDKIERPLPAEFLYLDNERIGAYLAQLNGGIAKSERLTERLIDEDNAKVSGNFFEVGASSQRENFVERVVTPTAAASYFRLLAFLLDQGQLEDVEVDNLDDFEGAKDTGTFIRFHSSNVRTPVYANPYLVVRQSGTLKALFPTASADELERAAILGRRENAKSFARQIGPSPRIVFPLTPAMPPAGAKEKRTRCKGGYKPGKDPEDGRTCIDESIRFLLPVRYHQLTDERSLIKDGGGAFTVVGKVVRVFPKPDEARGKNAAPRYVDSPTRETWEKPLENVPGALLRFASRKCTPGGGAEDEVDALRACVKSQLEEQIEIPADGGAVILPIAIYK